MPWMIERATRFVEDNAKDKNIDADFELTEFVIFRIEPRFVGDDEDSRKHRKHLEEHYS